MKKHTKLDIKNLPSDVNALQDIIANLVVENIDLDKNNSELKNNNSSLKGYISNLEQQLKLLRHNKYGLRSEKYRDPNQLELELEDNQVTLSEIAGADAVEDEVVNVKEKDKKTKPVRKKLPEHLPREEVILNPDPVCPSCGGEDFRKIADDISETLEYVPASFKVIKHIRPRCACVNCEKIVQAYAPDKPIAKGKAGPGLLSHILIQKYCNHLPLYRQSQMFKRQDIDLPRSTLTSWAGQCSRLLDPLVEEIRKYIFTSTHIHGDDTPVKVLAPGTGKTKTGRIWTYVKDGRSYIVNSSFIYTMKA